MKIISVIIVICLGVSLTASKLLQVFSVSRHGARYHVYDRGNSTQTKALQGELTSVGMRQLQKLGQILRKQYIDGLKFLNPNYNSSEIQVYSTLVNRTQESITSLFQGLYPPGAGPKMAFVQKQWHLPPYPNKTDIIQQNFALPNGHQPVKVKANQKIAISNCPNYNKNVQINLQKISPELDQMMMTYKPLMNKIASIYNFSAQNATMENFLQIYDVLNVDSHLGRPFPPNITEADYLNLKHLANWYYLVTMGGNNTGMANSGKLSRMFTLFETRQKVPDAYALKWTFLSGHDTDIIALYLALNFSSYTCTEQLYRKGTTSALNCDQEGNTFATNLIFELHSDDNVFFNVKVRSNGKYMKLCNKNSEVCDYFTFKNSVKQYIVSNIDEVCGKKVNDKIQITQINEMQE